MLTRLVRALVARVRLGRPLSGSLTLANPSEAERSAFDRLLGRRPSAGAALTLRLSEVERVLREGGLCDSLEDAVHGLAGPVTSLRSSR